LRAGRLAGPPLEQRMSEALTPGILVEEFPGRETALDAFPEGVTAFLGAATRGPLGQAVAVDSAATFDRLFGAAGVVSPLQSCVHDFFAAGGQRAVIVRAANGGKACSIRLPGREGTLLLEALSPGQREYLRCSVDYDQIPPSDDAAFNLVVQRLRSPGTERVIDQEIYRRLSVRPAAENYVADALMSSALVRVRGATPPTRPAATVSTAPGHPVTWVDAEDDGDDGKALTDYDLVGSRAQGSGLFALDAAGPIDFLCLPPSPVGGGPGPALLLAALRYCRRRSAILLLEPPAHTNDAEQALTWLHGLNITGENAVVVFPQLNGNVRGASRPAAGAVAGSLARAPADVQPVLGPQFRPTHELPVDMRRRLQAAGMNIIGRGRGGRITLDGDRTLASPECPVQAWHSLVSRRLALTIERVLLQGTRWAVFDSGGEDLAERLRIQVTGWLESLRFAGLLAGGPGEAWFLDLAQVAAAERPGRVEFTVGFAPRRAGEFVIYRVSQGLNGARLAPVSAERWAISRPARATGTAGGLSGDAREAG